MPTTGRVCFSCPCQKTIPQLGWQWNKINLESGTKYLKSIGVIFLRKITEVETLILMVYVYCISFQTLIIISDG